jgi:hypothetical protein
MIIIKSIASPAGSGMNFAQDLLNLSFDKATFATVGHERKDMEDTPGKQIAILRNPYDTIASGAERWIKSSNHKDFVDSEDLLEESNIEGIKHFIGFESKRYYDFFNNIEALDKVKVISFEFLTQQRDAFLDFVQKYYELEKFVINRSSDEDVFDKIKLRNNVNRVPREKANARKIIDNLIIEMYSKDEWECWKIYSDIKAKLDEQGL